MKNDSSKLQKRKKLIEKKIHKSKIVEKMWRLPSKLINKVNNNLHKKISKKN